LFYSYSGRNFHYLKRFLFIDLIRYLKDKYKLIKMKSYFDKNNLSLLVYKSKKIIFSSREKRIRPLFVCVRDNNTKGCSAIDKIVGEAAALLFIYGKIKQVHAITMSKSALVLLQDNKIKATYDKLVESILNDDRTDICPMEKLAKKTKEPKKFFEELSKIIKF
jgi:hypothetical protein